MQQLSNLDAAFLYLESDNAPMHIGCILTFNHPAYSRMTFDRFKAHIAQQLPGAPIFRRRLSRLPWDIDRPYWIEDADFNIDQHLKSTQVSEAEFPSLVDRFFEERLNTRRALWSMLYVEDTQAHGDQFRVLIKFHHAAIDGVSGEKILTAIMSPQAQAGAPREDHWQPHPPSATLMLANKVRTWWRTPKELSALSRQLGKSIKSSRVLRSQVGAEQPAFFSAPATPYNQSIETGRHLVSAELSLKKIKEIKNRFEGCTVNDVVLAICAGALREHLLSEGQLPATPIIAMSPVSKRQGDEAADGNLISAMLVSLATDIASPLERLLAIQKNTQQAKRFNREVQMEQVIRRVPSLPASLALKTYTRFRVAKAVNPVFNLIITNVPGSPTPLYLDGAPLIGLEGMAPIVDNMGLTLVVTSYLDHLTISITTFSRRKAEVQKLVAAMAPSLDELYALKEPMYCPYPAPSRGAHAMA